MIPAHGPAQQLLRRASGTATLAGFVFAGLGLMSVLMGMSGSIAGSVAEAIPFFAMGAAAIAIGVTAWTAAGSLRRRRLWAATVMMTLSGLVVLGVAVLGVVFVYHAFVQVGAARAVVLTVGSIGALVMATKQFRLFGQAKAVILADLRNNTVHGFEPILGRPTPAPPPARSTPSTTTDDTGSPGRTPTSRGG